MCVAMNTLGLLNAFLEEGSLITADDQLFDALEALSKRIGFRYFALTHHLDFGRMPVRGIRLHNYPADWVRYFDSCGLGLRDPVHRASQVTGTGFSWTSLADYIALDRDDRDVLERARRAGIGEGYTVPVHVPGEYSGSCSFAMEPGARISDDQACHALLLGLFAFETARRLHAGRCSRSRHAVMLTPKQRQCVIWLGRGKSEWEVAKILGLSPGTVNEHLKRARERCGVTKSSQLIVYALLSGSISYDELLTH